MDTIDNELPGLSKLIEQRRASKTSFAARRNGMLSHRLARPAIFPRRGNPRACRPSGKRLRPASVISHACTGRSSATSSAVWP
jgi:hypothetical protein